MKNGYGVEEWPNGTLFKGNFNDDKKNGKGKFTWVDESYYEGDI